ncbi:MAG TPA: hypothetical protein VE620_03070 [Myxococcales bacterium]|jgi:hypothetical protein|nr:hypothetical protein [Myxococcales bacterium]
MARKSRGQVRPPGAPGAQQSQPPRPQGGGSWAPLRDAIRRDIEQAAAALAFATVLHERLDAQRRLFADFPRVMEQLRSGALERVATALARLFEGKDQFDLTRFVRDLPLALAQLAAAESARKSMPPPQAAKEAAAPASPAAGASTESSEPPAPADDASAAIAPEATADVSGSTDASPSGGSTANVAEQSTASATAASTDSPPAEERAPVPTASTPDSTASPPSATNGGAAPEPPSPRVELRGKLLAAAPQLGRAVVTYRRTVTAVRRAAAPRRAPGPWRSDREVLEDARLAVDFARQLFDAYAEAWADQPTQSGLADGMGAETDRFLAWTQLARYMDVAAPRSQPPPAGEKQPERPSEKQPVTQGTGGAGGTVAEGEPAHG